MNTEKRVELNQQPPYIRLSVTFNKESSRLQL